MTSPILTKSGVLSLIGIAVPVAMLLFITASPEHAVDRPDSGSYLRFANDVLSGELYERKELAEIHDHRGMRTPGYPFIIAIAKAAFTDELEGLLFIHRGIAVLTLIFVCIALRPYCSTLLTGVIVVGAQFAVRHFYPAILTEWLAFNLLLVLLGLLVIFFRTPSASRLLAICVLIALTVLVRPALAPLVLLVPLLIFFVPTARLRATVVLAAAVLPIMLWMGFNYYHLGAFAMSTLSGHNLFGIGALIGHASAEPDDPEELRLFIEEVNNKKDPPTGTEQEYVANLDQTYGHLNFIFDNNVFRVAYRARKPEWNIVEFDRVFLRTYGIRALRSNIGGYLAYFAEGMKTFVFHYSPFLTLYLLLIPGFSLWRGKNRVLAYTAVAMFAIHLSHSAFVAAVQVLYERYINLTFFPYVAACALCLCGLIIAEGWPEKGLNRLPPGIRKRFGRLTRGSP